MKKPAAHFSPVEFKALQITSTLETGKPLDFGGLAGNFDKQGLSFGLLQWNIKSGSLQPLLKDFIRLSPVKFAEIFGDHAESFRDLLFNKSPNFTPTFIFDELYFSKKSLTSAVGFSVVFFKLSISSNICFLFN